MLFFVVLALFCSAFEQPTIPRAKARAAAPTQANERMLHFIVVLGALV
jgi:hypothetical protein